MASSKQRAVFALGTLVGATAGVVAAFRGTDVAGRKTRDQIQQSLERVLFRVLDMVPFQNEPIDTVTASKPSRPAVEDPLPPVDLVIGSRPSEASIQQ